MFDIKSEVIAAENRIRPYVRKTPLDYSIAISRKTKANVFLKCENLQYTGAFKVRGAINKLLSLSPPQLNQGIVTASSGNHGVAVAFGLNKLNIQGMVFIPKNASRTKIDNISNYNIPVEFYDNDCMKTELHAVKYAKQHNMVYISPYNDMQVISGQGTIGLELITQLDVIDVVLVPVGGGGLISGIAWYLKSLSPKINIIGCLPENSPVMAKSIKMGQIIEMKISPTFSDATVGGIELGTITFDMCRKFVDDYILVSEEEIKSAIVDLLTMQHLLVEGAAGVALAALIKNRAQFYGKNVIVILSGANISLEILKLILD